MVVLVDGIDAPKVPIHKGDRRKTLLQGCADKINVDVPTWHVGATFGIGWIVSHRKSH